MQLKKTLHIPPWLFDTLLRIEEQDPDQILCIPIGGVRNLGKTTAIIQIIRHLASKQPVGDDGVRRLSWGILRETYADFDQILESFEEWFNLVPQYSLVNSGQVEGFSYKEMIRSPRMVVYERTPDVLSLMLDGTVKWDGTYTQINFRGFSYNKPGADARMRGWNLGSGWVNEAQTLIEKPISSLLGAINRPTGQIVNSVSLIDFNLPESTDNGYDYLKKLLSYNGAALDGSSDSGDDFSMDIYFPKLPAPYKFEKDPDGTFMYEDIYGKLVENDNFLVEAPHLPNLNNYAQYRLMSDDEKRRNLFGEFGKKNIGKVIYNEFDLRKHVGGVELPNKHNHEMQYILMPIDFGFNPGVLFAYVEDSTINIFHEIVIRDINFYELLSSYAVPYLETKLPHYWMSAPGANQTRIIPIGDPTSGSRRDAVKSASPVGVLEGRTDINGDEDGPAETFHFVETVPSPCGNIVEHRLQLSKQALSRPNGVLIDRSCQVLIEALDSEYVAGPSGSPLKKNGSIYHNAIDAFQYLCVYVAHDKPTERVKKSQTKRKPRHNKNKTRYV